MHKAKPIDYGDADGPECLICGVKTVGDRHVTEPEPARARALPPVDAPIASGTSSRRGDVALLRAAPRIGSLRERVIDAIRQQPMTDDELEVALDRTHQSVSACRNRLVADGWLEPLYLADLIDSEGRVLVAGEAVTRKTRSGNDATVWRLTDAARDNLGVSA